MYRSKPIAIAALAIAFATQAEAGEDVHGARTASMGSAAAADPSDDSAVTVNPSLLGLTERYDGDFQLRVGGPDLITVGGSAVDSRTASPVAFGLTYQFSKRNPPLTEDDLPGWVPLDEDPTNFQNTHLMAAGLAVPVLDRKLSFGVSGTVLIWNHEHQGSGIAHDYDVGIAAAPFEALSIGVTGRNLVPFPSVPVDMDPSILGGVSLHGAVGALAVDGEYRLDPTAAPFALRAGAELTPGSGRLRAGFRSEGGSDSWLTWGFGAQNDTSAVEYGMSLPLSGLDAFGDIMHHIAIRLRT